MERWLSPKKVEIYESELLRYKRIERNYIRLDNDLTEYMGFSDEYLRSDKWLMKYNKKDLVTKIHEQRCVIRNIINESEPSKREKYINQLQLIEDGDQILK